MKKRSFFSLKNIWCSTLWCSKCTSARNRRWPPGSSRERSCSRTLGKKKHGCFISTLSAALHTLRHVGHHRQRCDQAQQHCLVAPQLAEEERHHHHQPEQQLKLHHHAEQSPVGAAETLGCFFAIFFCNFCPLSGFSPRRP